MNLNFHVVDGPDGHKQVTVMLGDIIIVSMILRPAELHDLATVLRNAAYRLM